MSAASLDAIRAAARSARVLVSPISAWEIGFLAQRPRRRSVLRAVAASLVLRSAHAAWSPAHTAWPQSSDRRLVPAGAAASRSGRPAADRDRARARRAAGDPRPANPRLRRAGPPPGDRLLTTRCRRAQACALPRVLLLWQGPTRNQADDAEPAAALPARPLEGVRRSIAALPASKIREVADAGIGRADLIPLWFGEPDVPTPAFICEAASRALAGGRHLLPAERRHSRAARRRSPTT